MVNLLRSYYQEIRSYYQEIRRRKSSEKSDTINTGISELDYEKVDEEFELINDQFKVPIFVEFDEDALSIWERFVNLQSMKSRRPTRSEVIQIRYEMEQYMIGVSQKEVEAALLEDVSGIYRIPYEDIGNLYNEITGFVQP
jgi:CRISPR-associated endonuclease/helicase Cas3